MTQCVPSQGVYVKARQYEGRMVVTIINGTRRTATMEAKRYAELTAGNSRAREARDVVTGERYDLTKNLTLKSRQVMVLEF
jgi:hypothetical protein